MKTLGSIGAWTVREIMAIHGVMEIRIKPKEILIKKEMSSSWEGIEDRVINVLKRAMRRKQIRLVKH
ncbi:MAG: NifU N-terminal domain-containing protein [Proteobacteria bacterium]|nr:NifU N-terminal domain-containing protein [Pseudomonadota bacterium]